MSPGVRQRSVSVDAMHDGSAVARAWRRVVRFHDAHPVLATLILAAAMTSGVYWSLLVHLRSATPADPDSALFVWSMQHAPRRLLHFQNPFFSSAIFATSGGANLAFSATAPLLGLLMSPITYTLGPVAAFNLLTALTPVLNALAARRLLSMVSGVSGVAVALGALLVGFSPLVMMHNGARQQLVFQALSLLLLCELWQLGRDYLDDRPINRRRAVVGGALAGAQMWIGSEQLAIVAIMVVVVALVAVVLRRSVQSPVRLAPRGGDLRTALAGLGTLVLVASPFLAAFLFGSERYTSGYHVPARPLFGLRLANLLTATDVTLLHSHLPLAVDRIQLSVFRDEDTGYIGLVSIVALMLILVTWRRRNLIQRGAVIVGATCWLLALGPTVRWSGTGSGVPGPWRIFEQIPVVQEIVANRLSMAMFLALGVLVATVGQTTVTAATDVVAPSSPERRFERWTERSLALATWCVPLLLIPAAGRTPKTVSSAAEHALERSCRGTLVVTMPQSLEQDAMAWQARSNFAFDLYRGFAFRASTLPKGDRLLMDDIAESGLVGDDIGAGAIDELRSRSIGCVVSPASASAILANLAPVLGAPIVAGDVALWASP